MADKNFKIPKKVKISKKKISKPTEKRRRRNTTDDEKEIFAKNRIEDVRWLCSLSESELDFLISLKTLIIRRATVAGHESLVEKFDLNMLRALSYALMEHCKEEMKGSLGGDVPETSAACLGRSNLLRVRLGEEEFGGMGVEELMGYLRISKNSKGGEVDEDFESMGVDESEMMGFVYGAADKKRFADMFSEDLEEPGKRKKSNGADEDLE